MWTSLQEENVQPSPDLLIYLANFLREKNLAIPFIVPTKTTEQSLGTPEEDRTSKTTTGQNKELRKAKNSITGFRSLLDQNDLDGALEQKQR